MCGGVGWKGDGLWRLGGALCWWLGGTRAEEGRGYMSADVLNMVKAGHEGRARGCVS